MINNITLCNFQSHPETSIDLNAGINSIIGSSDSGKSAILRALYWIVNNRPAGTAFISYWAKDTKGNQTKPTSVSVTRGERTAARIRTKDLNGYDFAGNMLEAIRTDVPAEIQSFFHMSEVNIQKQMDAPFLLSDTAGAIARFFNSIIKLDSIDSALSAADKKKRECKAELKTVSESMTAAEKKIQEFGWLPEAEKLIDRAEKYHTGIQEKEKEIRDIESGLEKYQAAEDIIRAREKILSAAPLVENVEKILAEIQDISVIVKIISDFENIYNNALSVLNKTGTLIEISECGLIEKAESLADKIESRGDELESLRISVDGYTASAARVKSAGDKIQELTAQMPDTCPTCGRPWEDK